MSNIQMVRFLIALLVIVILIFSVTFYAMKKKEDRKQQEKIYLKHRSKKGSFLYASYEFFSQWFLTKRYVRKINYNLDMQYPGDKKLAAQKTMKITYMVWSIATVIIIGMLLMKPSFYVTIVMLTLIYVINYQIVESDTYHTNIKLLKQLREYTGEIRHYYYLHGMIDEAMEDTIETIPSEIRLHVVKMLEILRTEDIEEEVCKYNDTVPNRFYKMFLALCVTLVQYGDKEVDGKSLFLSNLLHLKEEINIEILDLEDKKYKFAGHVFICMLPIFFIQAIENWAISNSDSMKDYYSGAYGIILMVLIFITTIIGYNAINRLKETRKAEVQEHYVLEILLRNKYINNLVKILINRNYGKNLLLQDELKKIGENITIKEFYLKRVLYSVGTCILCSLVCIVIHQANRNNAIYNTENIKNLTSAASKKQIEELQKSVTQYTNKYKRGNVDRKELANELIEAGTIKNKEIMTIAIDEVIKRTNRYRIEYLRWYEIACSILFGFFSCYIPVWSIRYRKKILQMSMEDEVIQFQSIIIMLHHIDCMTIEEILSWMENFSAIFKISIQECLNQFQESDVKALEELKIKEPYEPFLRIIENLEMCDKIGIEKAFEELESERIAFQEKRKQENKIITSKRATIAYAISYVPFILTFGFYLIVPFVVQGLSELMKFFNEAIYY